MDGPHTVDAAHTVSSQMWRDVALSVGPVQKQKHSELQLPHTLAMPQAGQLPHVMPFSHRRNQTPFYEYPFLC